jgi:drug/metabolite transporter (DMT)-like permease
MRLFFLTLLSVTAFAGNSLLCRIALKTTAIDAASFTLIRMASGALVLGAIVRMRGNHGTLGSWGSAFWLFAYAIAFSLAYMTLSAATGALLLFGAVQATMIAYGLLKGERLRRVQWAGLVTAFAGLGALLLPGLSAPPLTGAALMIASGIAWGFYSLRGRTGGDPTSVTAGNFLRAVPFALLASLAMMPRMSLDGTGIACAIASGALASGVGYAIWYTALPALKATIAATVQLSVPILAALGGIAFLGEPVTLRLFMCSAAILGGVALVVRRPVSRSTPAAVAGGPGPPAS